MNDPAFAAVTNVTGRIVGTLARMMNAAAMVSRKKPDCVGWGDSGSLTTVADGMDTAALNTENYLRPTPMQFMLSANELRIVDDCEEYFRDRAKLAQIDVPQGMGFVSTRLFRAGITAAIIASRK